MCCCGRKHFFFRKDTSMQQTSHCVGPVITGVSACTEATTLSLSCSLSISHSPLCFCNLSWQQAVWIIDARGDKNRAKPPLVSLAIFLNEEQKWSVANRSNDESILKQESPEIRGNPSALKEMEEKDREGRSDSRLICVRLSCAKVTLGSPDLPGCQRLPTVRLSATHAGLLLTVS